MWSPQGGYLMAMALRAFGLATSFPKPLSLACHFLSVPKVGTVELQLSSLRKTRIAESLRLSMVQEGRETLVEVAGSFRDFRKGLQDLLVEGDHGHALAVGQFYIQRVVHGNA